MIHKIKIVAILILLSTSFTTLRSQNETKIFRDTLDGAFDISKWLFELNGFIPLVSPITEPAVGYGLAIGGVYFIPQKKTENGKFKMPDAVGLFGGFTQNKTWFAGGGYAGFWKDDHIRYRGFIGYANVNLKYYGSGNKYLANNPANFTLESYFYYNRL